MYTIMIIDDDATSLAIGKALLEPEYKVLLMRSGIQALGYMKNNLLPDLILLDLYMPGTSGMELLQMLKVSDSLYNIPVLFLTSTLDLNVLTEGIRSGAADFIQKPVVPALLRQKISMQLSHVSLAKENKYLKERVADLEACLAVADSKKA